MKLKLIIKNITFLGLSQTIKIILRFIVMALIARQFGPGNYGNYVVVLAFVDFFILFTLPGITKPLVREGCREPKKISELLQSKVGIRNLLILLAILICNTSALISTYSSEIKILIIIYSLNLLTSSLRSYIQVPVKVYEKFNLIAIVEIFESVLFAALALLTYFLKLSYAYLVFFTLFTNISALLADYYFSRKIVSYKMFSIPKFEKEFLLSSFFFSLTNLFWIVVTRTDLLMISFIGNSEEVGIYNVANRLVAAGLMGLGIISKTIYPSIVKKMDTGYINLSPHRKQLIFFLSLLFFITFILIATSKYFIPFIFGNSYTESISIFNVLLFYLLIQFLTNPVTLILQALDREKNLMMITLPLPILNLIANYSFYKIFGLIGISFSTILVYSFYLISMIWSNKKILAEKLVLKNK